MNLAALCRFKNKKQIPETRKIAAALEELDVENQGL